MRQGVSKILLSLILIAASVSVSYADEQSGQLLKQLGDKISSLGNYHVKFTVTAEGNLSEGEYVVSGDKYYMVVEDIEIICDGKTRYEINHMDEEVVVDNVNLKDINILSNPTRAFDFADESFTHVYEGEMTERCQACNFISLEPKDKNTSVSNITLAIDKASGLPFMLKYKVDGLNGEVEVFVNEFTSDRKTPASRFVFDKKNYKGYEIIDFR